MAGVKQGIFVQEVIKGGPAERAGMKQEDVIVSINGKPIDKGQDLIDHGGRQRSRQHSEYRHHARQEPMTLNVMVADRVKTFSDNPVVAQNPDQGNSPAEGVQKFGISIGALSMSDKQSAGYTGTGSVVIESVEPDRSPTASGWRRAIFCSKSTVRLINSPEDVKRIQAALKPGDT